MLSVIWRWSLDHCDFKHLATQFQIHNNHWNHSQMKYWEVNYVNAWHWNLMSTLCLVPINIWVISSNSNFSLIFLNNGNNLLHFKITVLTLSVAQLDSKLFIKKFLRNNCRRITLLPVLVWKSNHLQVWFGSSWVSTIAYLETIDH